MFPHRATPRSKPGNCLCLSGSNNDTFPASLPSFTLPHMTPEADLLKEVPLFNLLDDHERAELAAQLDVVRFAAGETIFQYGEPGDSIYVMRSGEVEVFCKNDTGERMVLEVAT